MPVAIGKCRISLPTGENWLNANNCTVQKVDEAGADDGPAFDLPIRWVAEDTMNNVEQENPDGAVIFRGQLNQRLITYLNTESSLPTADHSVKFQEEAAGTRNVTASPSGEGPGPFGEDPLTVEVVAVKIG